MNKADLNTLEDWENEGFETGVMARSGADVILPAFNIPGSARAWNAGWEAGRLYRRSIADRIASPRDTEISDLKDFIR